MSRRCLLILLAYVASEGGLAAGERPADVAICAHLDGARPDVAPVSKTKLELLRALAVSMDFTIPSLACVPAPVVAPGWFCPPPCSAPPAVDRIVPRPPSS